MTKITTIPDYNNIRSEIVELLNAARRATSRNVNALMTATYWEIGRRIVQSEQAGENRAGYGDMLIQRLAKDLSASFGRGFGPRNLAQMRSFYLAWPHGKILQTLSAKSSTRMPFNEMQRQSRPVQDLANRFPLPWSAYVRLLSVKNPEARNFYEAEARRSGWSIRQLDRQIGSQSYERLALSKNKAAMLEKAQTSEPSELVTPEEAIKDLEIADQQRPKVNPRLRRVGREPVREVFTRAQADDRPTKGPTRRIHDQNPCGIRREISSSGKVLAVDCGTIRTQGCLGITAGGTTLERSAEK